MTQQHLHDTIPDYRQEFSLRNLKNYAAIFLVPFGTQGLSALLFSTYLSKVYVDYLGVSAAVIGLVISIGIIVDGVTDLLMGVVTDRVRSRWGKARHWFFISCVPVCLSMILMFMVPEQASSTAKVAFVFIMYNLFCTLLTTVRLPAASLTTLVSDNTQVRNNMCWIYEVANAVSSSALGWIVAPVIDRLGENLHAFRVVTVICGVISMAALFFIGVLVSEMRSGADWKQYDEAYKKLHQTQKRESLPEQLKNLLKNKWWVIWQIFYAFYACGFSFIFGVMAYWLGLVLGDSSQIGVLLTVMNVPNVVGAICYVVAARFLSNKKILLFGTLLQFLCALGAWIAGAGAWGTLLILLAGKCFFSGIASPATRAIIPQIIDYGEWRTGSRQEGLANAGTTVMNKIVSAAASAIVGFILFAAGYAGAGTETAAAVSWLNFLFLGVPCLCLGCAFIIMLFFRLDDQDCEKYRAEIASRKQSLTDSEG